MAHFFFLHSSTFFFFFQSLHIQMYTFDENVCEIEDKLFKGLDILICSN